MRTAVIVSTARTPIGKAYRGAFNNTEAPALGGHAVKQAVLRAGLDPSEVEDVIMGCAMPQGTQGGNIARQIALAAGLPVTTAGMTVDRQCSSGMMAIALAAKTIVCDGVDIMVGGGLESISLVQNENMNLYRAKDPRLLAVHKDVYMPMIDTAEVVAKRYGISRDAQDEFALQSQQRTAASQAAGRFDAEIVPMSTSMGVMDKETKAISFVDVTLEKDEGNRPDTTIEGLASLKPVREGGFITAGNASQLSDGASASVLMEAKVAEKRALTPLGIYRGTAVAGCKP
ncbi:MAG: acetyl-CoA C-acyltransferase, partial [Gammaproteobacteria bacterium]|nr:acetyl-CoA C-acyltransferase [Gammaproteobacteria bacterium]